MEQYLDLGEKILIRGIYKAPARANMPGTKSLFGAQFRCDLADGFPILTTKKLSFKNIVTELLWFMKGDTNIKFLVDSGCNIWNEDAYNYYRKVTKDNSMTFQEFIERVKENRLSEYYPHVNNYKLGDCGKQYGWLWRKWSKEQWTGYNDGWVDQLQELVTGLKTSPTSRRHIITAWNPATLDDMALNACHAFVQFNCRPVNFEQVAKYMTMEDMLLTQDNIDRMIKGFEESSFPKYYLDCQLYQRSADYILGVPYNIASYALLTEILAKITNMIPGEFIHTFGDVHIYDNHMEAVKEQLSRQPEKLPKLKLAGGYDDIASTVTSWEDILDVKKTHLFKSAFSLEEYNPQPSIKAKLSTGLV